MTEQLKGRRVRVTMNLPTVVEAVVAEESDHGFVLDLDVSTATVSPTEDFDGGVVRQYLGRRVPGVQHPTWLGRAHRDKLEVLDDSGEDNVEASRLLDAHHAVEGTPDAEGFLDNCDRCGYATGWLDLPGADFGHTTAASVEEVQQWIKEHTKAQVIVSKRDPQGLPRAYGVADTTEQAREIADTQLREYIAEKNALGYGLEEGDFTETIGSTGTPKNGGQA